MQIQQLETPLHLLASEDRLKKAGIRHFDELIHDQTKAWLVKNFGEAGWGGIADIMNWAFHSVLDEDDVKKAARRVQ